MKFKRILLSLAFMAVFGLYAIYERSFNSSNLLPGITPITVTNSVAISTPTSTQNAGSMMGQSTNTMMSGKYRNGQYTGNSANAYYGLVQVKAIISGGKLTDVQFLDYPQDNRNSLSRSNYALPQLRSEAIQSQSASVDTISSATLTSRAFIQSLSSALSQAV